MFTEVIVFLCEETFLEREELWTMFEVGNFDADSIIAVLGRMISEIGKISQFDAHWPNIPFVELDPNSDGWRPTRLLLFRSWRMEPITCLKDPESPARPPAD